MQYANIFNLEGKCALVTGANGILGRHYVAGLSQHGATVIIADIDEDACLSHADETPNAVGIQLDVSDPGQVQEVVSRIARDHGRIDILMNNAATKGKDLRAMFASTEEYAPDTWREIMAVNLDGQFYMARTVGPLMAEAGGGSIINVSSIYGIVGPDQRIYEGSQYLGMEINTPAVYSASKAGVIGLTRYLATLWADRAVRVNALTPGGVSSGQNGVFQKAYATRTPLGRMAHASEMVGALIYLASDASSYVTGHNLVVDGGWTIW